MSSLVALSSHIPLHNHLKPFFVPRAPLRAPTEPDFKPSAKDSSLPSTSASQLLMSFQVHASGISSCLKISNRYDTTSKTMDQGLARTCGKRTYIQQRIGSRERTKMTKRLANPVSTAESLFETANDNKLDGRTGGEGDVVVQGITHGCNGNRSNFKMEIIGSRRLASELAEQKLYKSESR